MIPRLEAAEPSRVVADRGAAGEADEVVVGADPVELRDRVPYSEQEDLIITYTAEPEPDIKGVDDRRGILQWNVELAPEESAVFTTSFRMRWPEGKVVR